MPKSCLLAFKPRQVLLLQNNMKQSNPVTSTDLKSPLLHAVAAFLQTNGFSKTLKKFLSEASIEKNRMKESSVDLEVMYCKYTEMCNKDNTSVSRQKDNGNVSAPENDAKSKDKKKNKKTGNNVSDTPNGIEQLEPEIFGDTKESLKDHTSVIRKDVDDSEAEKKSKDKKKNKNKSNDSNQMIETISNGNLLDVKPKMKSKKESFGGEDKRVVGMEDARDTVLTEEEVKISDVDATDNEDKSSKRRKRFDSEENYSDSEKSKEFESAEKSSMSKSVKKQWNDSNEPRTVKAFQRVKAEEVVFIDEKFKDNSYWAKDGADTGYGAKAQEILGQVRGKDFRHEKTKKKRGSYRGGQIDLRSHSVKFNYSDEE